MTDLRVYITLDIDPDYTNSLERTKLSWDCLNLLPRLNIFFKQHNIKFTFFIRIDNQIKDIYGKYLGVYYRYSDLWENLLSDGNELGWHPHLYKIDQDKYVPLQQTELCCDILKSGWDEIIKENLSIKCVRIGEAWHSTATMCQLNELGIQIDSTAVPKRKRNDGSRTFDWLISPNIPYHPCRSDYRKTGDESLNILEVPMTTALIKTNYDQKAIPRYLNPTFNSILFKMGIDNIFEDINKGDVSDLVLIFHPDELMNRPANDLYAYNWECFESNITYLLEKLSDSKKNYKFCCLREVLNSRR